MYVILPLTFDYANPTLHPGKIVSGLTLPPELMPYELGLLKIHDMDNQPTLLVCLRCRTSFRTKAVVKLLSHRRSCCNSPSWHADSANPLLDDQPGEESTLFEDVAFSGDLNPLTIDIEDDDFQHIEDEEQLPVGHFTPRFTNLQKLELERYLTEQLIVTDFPVRPTLPLVNNHFFRHQIGYECPVTTCSFAGKEAKTVRQHLEKAHSVIQLSEILSPSPSNCIGTFYGNGSTSAWFKLTSSLSHPITAATLDQTILTTLKNTTDILSSAAPEGNCFLSPMYQQFRYHTIFPPAVDQRSQFVLDRLTKSSYHFRRDQEPIHQLLHMSIYHHMAKTRLLLSQLQPMYRTHLATLTK
jgi:hypothetical protein